MENKMKTTARNYGGLDGNLASYVLASSLSEKIKSYVIVGANADVDFQTDEDVWNVGGRLTYLSAPSVLQIASTSADDAVGGLGVEMVKISGINGNYDLDTEVVALSGLTNVPTVKEWLRVHLIVALKPEAIDPNIVAVGVITATAGTVQCQINAGFTASSMSMFTIPRSYSGFLDQVIIAGGANDDFLMSFSSRPKDGLFASRGDFEITSGNVHDFVFDPKLGLISEMSDTKFVAMASTQNSAVRITHTLTIIRNDLLKSLVASI